MTPYRTAPAERPAQKAPRASWWRLASASVRGLQRRLEVRRIRHQILRDLPGTSWVLAHECADLYPREAGAVLGLYIGYQGARPSPPPLPSDTLPG